VGTGNAPTGWTGLPSRQRRVAVIGAGKCDAGVYSQAKQLGQLLAKRGYLVVCGGLGGVMQAVCEGAKSASGATLGILPGDKVAQANPFVDTAVVTGLGSMRNYLVVLNGDAVVAVEGESGTLSELALALKSGKYVVAVGRWAAIPGVVPAACVEEAVERVAAHLEAEPSA